MENDSSKSPPCNWTNIIGAISEDACDESVEEGGTKKYDYGHGLAAGWYVIIVIVFYGTSVMLLIASHIKRKHQKIQEDRQINSYLKEFQVVRERSSRENYRTLKKNTIATLSRMGVRYGKDSSYSALYRCLSQSLMPITALAFSAESTTSLHSKNSVITTTKGKALQSIEEDDEFLRNGELHVREKFGKNEDYQPLEQPLHIIVEIEKSQNSINAQEDCDYENKILNSIPPDSIVAPTTEPTKHQNNSLKPNSPRTFQKTSPYRSLSEETHTKVIQPIKRPFPPERSISSNRPVSSYATIYKSSNNGHQSIHPDLPRTPGAKTNIEQISSV